MYLKRSVCVFVCVCLDVCGCVQSSLTHWYERVLREKEVILSQIVLLLCISAVLYKSAS